jgi:hypothetical protein
MATAAVPLAHWMAVSIQSARAGDGVVRCGELAAFGWSFAFAVALRAGLLVAGGSAVAGRPNVDRHAHPTSSAPCWLPLVTPEATPAVMPAVAG